MSMKSYIRAAGIGAGTGSVRNSMPGVIGPMNKVSKFTAPAGNEMPHIYDKRIKGGGYGKNKRGVSFDPSGSKMVKAVGGKPSRGKSPGATRSNKGA